MKDTSQILKILLIVSGVVLAVLIGISTLKPELMEGEPVPFVLQHCIGGHTTALQSHYHPSLTIIIDGETIPIPAETGVEDDCMRMVHTHDDTGKLHVEKEDASVNITIGDFFAVWGKTFTENQILDYKADATHEIVMTVDGIVNTEYNNYIPQDGESVVIEYQEIK